MLLNSKEDNIEDGGDATCSLAGVSANEQVFLLLKVILHSSSGSLILVSWESSCSLSEDTQVSLAL